MNALLKGVVVSLVLALFLALIVSLFGYFGYLTPFSMARFYLVVNFISIGIGGMIAANCAQSKGWLYGGFVGLVYTLFFLILIFLVPGLAMVLGSVAIMQAIILSFLVGTVGGIVGINI